MASLSTETVPPAPPLVNPSKIVKGPAGWRHVSWWRQGSTRSQAAQVVGHVVRLDLSRLIVQIAALVLQATTPQVTRRAVQAGLLSHPEPDDEESCNHDRQNARTAVASRCDQRGGAWRYRRVGSIFLCSGQRDSRLLCGCRGRGHVPIMRLADEAQV